MGTRNRNALVTGATGFIGSRVVGRLIAEGWTVHVLARSGSSLDLLHSDRRCLAAHVHRISQREMASRIRQIGPRVVFHLAARTQSRHEPEDVDPLIEANVAFPAELVEAMIRAGSRLFVGAETFWQSDGSGAYSPVCLYAATKQAFRDILKYYVEAEGLSALSLVLYDVYGPADPRDKLLNALAKAALTGQVLSVSPGDQMIELVHVDDVARAFAIAGDWLDSGKGSGMQTYGVFGGKARTLKEIVGIFAEVAQVPVPVHWGGRPHRPREVMQPYVGHPVLPGWHAEVDLRDGLREVLDWFKKDGSFDARPS